MTASATATANVERGFGQLHGQAEPHVYTGALDNSRVTVATTWTPDNHPGSTAQVKVSYRFATVLAPLPAKTVPVQTAAASIITQ